MAALQKFDGHAIRGIFFDYPETGYIREFLKSLLVHRKESWYDLSKSGGEGIGRMSQHQPYDSSMKAILKEDAPAILPLLLKGAIYIDVADIEVIQATMRPDRAYRIEYNDRPHIFQLEFQAGADEEIVYRVLTYHVSLLRDYQLPVISMIVYLFPSSMPESPLREVSGTEELLTFHFRVSPLWTWDAREYVQAHAISMYTLLPTMQHADAGLLLQAINELVEYYKDSEAKLARRLLWLSTFLRRAETVPLPDKQRVEEGLKMFEHLLEQNEFVQRQRALGREEGLVEGEAKGKVEGEVEASQKILVGIVGRRFPTLIELAKQRAARTSQVDVLREIIELVSVAPDEATARLILSPSAA